MLTRSYIRMQSLLSDDGSVATEYALLLGFIAVLLIGAMVALRGGIDAAYRTAIGPLGIGS